MAQALACLLDTGAKNVVHIRFPFAVCGLVPGLEQRGHDAGYKGIAATGWVNDRRHRRYGQGALTAVREHGSNRAWAICFYHRLLPETFW